MGLNESSQIELRSARAGRLVLNATDVIGPAEVRWGCSGLIEEIRPCDELTTAERASVLAPGFVNAHVHLDLGGLDGLQLPDSGFLGWVGEVVGRRSGWNCEDRAAGLTASIKAALAAGTTSVIDIDSTGWGPDDLPVAAPRILRCVELLDGSPAASDERTRAALDLLAELRPGHPSTDALRLDGVSPHGAHTVSDALWRAVGERLGGDDGLFCAVHWAETEEEVRWMIDGTGPFASWLGPTPGIGGIERLRRSGALKGTLLVHGNHPLPGEIDLLVREGAPVVHCPGSHLYFGREPFPYDAYRSAGARVVLGTDSLGSNAALDMAREARLAIEILGVEPEDAWRMVTEWPAELLPWEEVTGRLEVGAGADIVRHAGPSGPRIGSAGELLMGGDEWTVADVWVAGQRVAGPASN